MKSKFVFALLILTSSPAFAGYQVVCSDSEIEINKDLAKSKNIVSVSAPSVSIAKAAPGVALTASYSSKEVTRVETSTLVCVTVKTQ